MLQREINHGDAKHRRLLDGRPLRNYDVWQPSLRSPNFACLQSVAVQMM